MSKETPKQAVEIEEHEFKSPRIKAIVEETKTSIAEIPDRLPKDELRRIEKENPDRKIWKVKGIYEEKSELDELTPEQLQIL